jgi:hypothetical protein
MFVLVIVTHLVKIITVIEYTYADYIVDLVIHASFPICLTNCSIIDRSNLFQGVTDRFLCPPKAREGKGKIQGNLYPVYKTLKEKHAPFSVFNISMKQYRTGVKPRGSNFFIY